MAENNATFMKELEQHLRKRDIPFDHLQNRVMCFPHLINICVKSVLGGYGTAGYTGTNKTSKDEESDEESGNESDEDSGQNAKKRDAVAAGRKIVRVMRASGQRRDHFEDLIRTGNAKNFFKVDRKVVRVRSVQLLHDVKTRWDSVYLMIKRLREMRPVSDLMLPVPNLPDVT